jgi:hypothetical protein
MSEPITPECPIACLRLPRGTVLVLTPHLKTSEPTVGDVLRLWGTGLLEDLDGIGVGRANQIDAALRAAGLIHDHG